MFKKLVTQPAATTELLSTGNREPMHQLLKVSLCVAWCCTSLPVGIQTWSNVVIVRVALQLAQLREKWLCFFGFSAFYMLL